MKSSNIKLSLICILFFFFVPQLHAEELISRIVDDHTAKMIKITPDSGERIVVSASNEATDLKSLVSKVSGTSGVNGAFFCPKDYKECGGKSITNALRIMEGDGKTYSTYYPDMGINGLFGFDKNGALILLKNSIWSGNTETNFNTGSFDKVANGIANFPIYLVEGKNVLGNLYKESDIDAKMRTKSLKNFICAKKDGTILMGGIENATIFEMPNLLLKFDCYNAINLDTGGSTAMVYNGKYVKGPGRNIMDAFVVVKSPKKDDRADILLSKINAYLDINSKGDALSRERLKQKIKSRLNQISTNSKTPEEKKLYLEVSEML